MTTLPQYAELHCLSNFTFLRGASHAEELVERAATLGYAALAITDECSLAGVVRAHVAARQAGLPLIVGSEIRLADGPKLVLLAADREGYGNLSQLITRGRRAAEKGGYHLERTDLADGLPGCLALWIPDCVALHPGHEDRCSPDAGPRPESGRGTTTLLEQARWLAATFSARTWIAVERHLGHDDAVHTALLEQLGRDSGLPLVAAGDVHMHRRGRRALQDLLTAVRLGTTVARAGHALYPNGERHLRDRARLAELHPLPWLAETLRIAERCSFSLDELRYEYPHDTVPAGQSPAAYLRHLTEQGLRERWPDGAPDRVHRQVDYELAVIAELHYEPYFLTVHDIIRFARGRGILCQGRGSAANSAVCYCLNITSVDPSRMDMLFERFVSKERNEPPDIDVDFEHERREEVIQYIYQRYGRERAALAATVIRYRRRSALRDVGKALGLSPEQVNRLSGAAAWWDKGMAPERLREAGFDPDNPVIRRVLHLAAELYGFPRHLSQHVGGFVIARGPVTRLVPVENAAMAERTIIQWDKDDLDAMGLLKVDCLALGMLTAIHRAFDLMAMHHGRTLSLATVPAEDPAVYAMIQRADTTGVFQIESRAQMSMLPRLRPENFYDLVIEVAIVRPGPIQGQMVHPYLKRRQGLEPVTYPSEAVRDVLARTLGVPIFQEQVIKLAMVAAGFSAGEADQLRRAIGSWRRREKLEHFRQRLAQGMCERGYSEQFAQQIYNQIQGFGEYGFPESHAASFALLVYVSAWLKCHHPAAFACALLNSQPMGFYAPAQLVQDARRHGVEVRPVDVTVSGWDCALESGETKKSFATEGTEDTEKKSRLTQRRGGAKKGADESGEECVPTATHHDHRRSALGREHFVSPHPAHLTPHPALRLGLRMVRGLSRSGAERLVAARREGSFRSVADLTRRADLSRKDLEALAAADALAALAGHRHEARWQALGVEGTLPLFTEAEAPEETPNLPCPTEAQDLVADYASVGLTLGRHPLALLRPRLQRLRSVTTARLLEMGDGAWVHLIALVITRQHPASAAGTIFLTLEDETGSANIVVWQRLAETFRREVLAARLLGVHGQLQREGEVIHLVAQRLVDHTALLGELQTRSRDFC